MSKVSTFCITALLLLFALTCTARPGPPFSDATPMKTQHEDVNDVEVEGINCEGVGEEECLMRRTLAAHVDYIYTQKQNP
ncbi:hypothetical protein RHGRI_032526 [Rhododendron griersonianum]|uniref:Phytosulfokine n=1 Tax=Rhododendron griersonianum TaxID=479676 RepID=A0AAV6IC38_9ERIC|nr:hypothetical protein RHGRI_032526 [Rhododendron griersonianum]